MGIIKNEKRPWLEDDPEMQNRLWVEERQEDIKKILPKEQPIDRIPLKCHELVIAPAVFFVLFFAVTSRRGLVFPFGTVVRYWFFVFIFSIGTSTTGLSGLSGFPPWLLSPLSPPYSSFN